jgi:hypothetical protein
MPRNQSLPGPDQVAALESTAPSLSEAMLGTIRVVSVSGCRDSSS